MCKEKGKYYITTAIAYTSKKPHIGNSYEIVLTDAIARYKRMQGYDVYFLTGTDEHGQKIEEYADKLKITPQQYVDKVAKEIKDICDLLNTSYDKFIRTTDEYHVKTVQKIFKKLYEQGDIYKSEYEGLYCTPCESFWTENQLVDNKCPDCGREVTKAKEEAYFLKLTKYQERLENFIEENPDFIYPESRKKEMINNFIKPGLQDLCVSRTSFKWGVPVDFDTNHIVYVWVDALSNYITALGFDTENCSDTYKKYWPADLHIIGKDILRFHTIYWPIILMALDLPLPHQIFGHPWFLFGNDKMSKSRGNVIYADDLVNIFGVDGVRYYLLSEMPHASDGSITYETVIERFNSDLANTLGNLVNRTIAMSNKYFDGIVMPNDAMEEIDKELISLALKTVEIVDVNVNNCKISDALEAIFNLARRSNKYIDETSPWILAKEEDKKARLGTVLYNLLESIRFIAILIKPFMPDTSTQILKQMNCDINAYSSLIEFGQLKSHEKVGIATPLFSRLDEKKLLEELNSKEVDSKSTKNEKTNKEESNKKIEGIAQIDIDEFFKSELIVVEVKECEAVKRSKKLLKFTLDDGVKERTVVSGIAQFYKPEELIGKKVIIVANLKPVKLCGVESQGMILSAESGEDNVTVITVDANIPNGSKLG